MVEPPLKNIRHIIALLLSVLVTSLCLITVPPGSAASAETAIIWSQGQVQIVLSPGGSATVDLTFTSSIDLQNVVFEAVPAIAGFLSFQPAGFSNVPADTQQLVHISARAPSGTPFGTYKGTVHLRLGSRTLPQTLNVTVDVWRNFTDSGTGVTLKYPDFGRPSQIELQTVAANIKRLDIEVFSQADNAFVTQIGVTLVTNTNRLSLSDWFEQNVDVGSGALFLAGVFARTTLNGADALELVAPMPNIYLAKNGPVSNIYALSLSADTIFYIKQSQVNELDLLGYSVSAQEELQRTIMENITVP